ncbi:hypothetical protein KIW84_066134 [Lathyrus oleraceus]|uniref:Uncharacterized protein n=1 Tax=Pisum sativum TaxID=3888 RepID=A0A9D5A898_PEA|nr:hypothetical protein KIW84_066134 [Pisum sativum]
MTKIFLKTLSSFYYERMLASAPSDFTEMVNMGMRLEEGVSEGRLFKEEVSSSKRYGNSFAKKKEGGTNVVLVGRQRRPHVRRSPQPCQHHHQVSSVIPMFSNNQSIPSRDIDDVNMIIPVFKTPEHVVFQFDSNNSNNFNRSVSSLVIRLVGPVSYASDRAVLYQYNATMLENGQEVPLPTTNSVVNIADVSKVTRSGHVLGPVFPKDIEDVGKRMSLKTNDDDEVLRLIKKSEFNMVEQLLQTPSKISVMSLLMNSEAHREALQKVLEQAYMEHDLTVDQFDHIMANITSFNNLSFYDEELPEEGRNHNIALHISMNCKEDALSNVLVDTGS